MPNWLSPLLASAVFAWSPLVQAGGLVIGTVAPVDVAFPSQPLFPGAVKWTASFSSPGIDIDSAASVDAPRRGRTSRLLLSEIEVTSGADCAIEVVDGTGTQVELINCAALAGVSSYWTLSAWGNSLALRVRGEDAAEHLAFRVTAHAYDTEGIVAQQIYGANGLLHVAKYAGELANVIAAVEPSVGYLTFTASNEKLQCSGFLVSEDYFITNFHCIADASICPSAEVRFGYQQTAFGAVRTGTAYRCASFVASDAALDVALVRLAGAPTAIWPALDLIESHTLLDPGVPLLMVQHPGSEAKQVSVLDCAVVTASAVAAVEFGHSCDTKEGASGSPIFTAAGVLVGLHRAGHAGAPGAEIPNIAVRWDEIYPWLLNGPLQPAGPN